MRGESERHACQNQAESQEHPSVRLIKIKRPFTQYNMFGHAGKYQGNCHFRSQSFGKYQDCEPYGVPLATSSPIEGHVIELQCARLSQVATERRCRM